MSPMLQCLFYGVKDPIVGPSLLSRVSSLFGGKEEKIEELSEAEKRSSMAFSKEDSIGQHEGWDEKATAIVAMVLLHRFQLTCRWIVLEEQYRDGMGPRFRLVAAFAFGAVSETKTR